LKGAEDGPGEEGSFMAIDQAPLGHLTQLLMKEIEDDSEIPENSRIGRVVTIVEVVGPESEVEDSTSVRVRTNARPYVALGLLESAKALQLRLMGV
jgi:hypothetical protein